MSNTRHAADDSELFQQSFASSPDFSTSISALLAAKRIALLADRGLCGVLWFIQWRSLEPRGLRKLAGEVLAAFPERIGTPAMRKIRLRPGKKVGRAQVIALRDEFPGAYPLRGETDVEYWGLLDYDAPQQHPTHYKSDDFLSEITDAKENLHEHLMQLCVDPAISFDISRPPKHFSLRESAKAAGVWYFDDLIGALKLLRSNYRSDLADTETNRQISGALDFCLRRRRMILIEGKAGIGKTAALKAWCDQQFGLARYVEVPSSNDDRSFFTAIAQSLGVARGTSYNGQQIKLRVEEALRASGLMLVLDESQFLWPQYIRPQGIPARMQWVKTMFDTGAPIALVALPKFSEWQQLYARRTLWDDDQLERRLNRKVVLPDAHSKDDLLKIARAQYPNGDKASWALLAGYALAATKKQASAITEALESARDIAEQQGRDQIDYDDIDAAIKLDFKPLPAPSERSLHPLKSRPALRVQSHCRPRSEHLQPSRTAHDLQSART